MIGTDNGFGEDRACNSGYGSQIADAILSRVVCVAQQVVSHGDVVPQPCGNVPAPSDERNQINVLLASWYGAFQRLSRLLRCSRQAAIAQKKARRSMSCKHAKVQRLNGRSILGPSNRVRRRQRAKGHDPATCQYMPQPGYSYRSLWWVAHNALDVFEPRGIHGQRVYVAPKAEMIVRALRLIRSHRPFTATESRCRRCRRWDGCSAIASNERAPVRARSRTKALAVLWRAQEETSITIQQLVPTPAQRQRALVEEDWSREKPMGRQLDANESHSVVQADCYDTVGRSRRTLRMASR